MKAVSGAVPPATWVVSFWVALSAGTLVNFTVMLGWALWKSAASFFIWAASPTQDWKVIVTGLVGSWGVTGWMVWPAWVSSPPEDPPPTQAVATSATTATAASARTRRAKTTVRECTMPASRGRGPQRCGSLLPPDEANRFAPTGRSMARAPLVCQDAGAHESVCAPSADHHR